MGNTKITEDQRLEAVRIAIDGGDPREYLAKLGSKNPGAMWSSIRMWCNGDHPELAEKLPKVIGHKPKTEKPIITEVTSTDICAMEKEEQVREKLTTTAVSHPNLGEFYFDKKFNSVDWRTPEGDEISLAPGWWKELLEDLPEIMKVLGVEL